MAQENKTQRASADGTDFVFLLKCEIAPPVLRTHYTKRNKAHGFSTGRLHHRGDDYFISALAGFTSCFAMARPDRPTCGFGRRHRVASRFGPRPVWRSADAPAGCPAAAMSPARHDVELGLLASSRRQPGARGSHGHGGGGRRTLLNADAVVSVPSRSGCQQPGGMSSLDCHVYYSLEISSSLDE